MSAFLVIMTLLTLLPTSALAASGSGTGIKPTDNTNYWTTRLLHDGTPYSYKPPMAAGKLLYCLDRGYGYRWGTASFLNSYTYTSATEADADTVLKTALAQSGMGELDAQQLENFKWMMTYIVDYKGEIPGSLFMAAQTYVWDHQTFKGEGDGDIDAGGFANADTYETYLGYIDWMLKEKAKEDAELQEQIEKYAAQGTVATVVEDDAAKWAVFAKSSVKGRQSFFGYYAPRKLVTTPTQPGEPDRPPAGDADITLKKVAAGTTQGLDGAKFNIYRDGQIVGSDVTKNGGIIEVKDVTIITVDGVDVEVAEDVYLAYSQADRRERYVREEQFSGKLLSLEQMAEDDLLPDYVGAEAAPSAEEEALEREQAQSLAERKEMLLLAMLSLNDADRELINALFFDGASTRDYAARIGITQRAVIKRRDRILRDLKKYFENFSN